MKKFEKIDPLTVKQDPRVVADIQDDRKPHRHYYFLIDQEYVILANTTWKEMKQKWLHYQIEFPKQGLLWFLDSLLNKFTKTEAEGGLPKNSFSDTTEVNGERLKLRRAFGADDNGGAGYSFITLDRKDRLSFAEKYTFTDTFIFENGLLEVMQDVPKRIESGEL